MADCRHVKIIQSREQLAALPPGPKAVLATLPNLEAGASRDLLVDWASDPHSLIILTERPQVRVLSSSFLLLANLDCCRFAYSTEMAMLQKL